MRSKHVMSATVPGCANFPALRHALRPSGMGIVRDHAAQSLQVGGRIAAVSDGQGEAVLDSARPSFQGHPFGLGREFCVGGAGRPAEASEVGDRAGHAHDRDEQAVSVGRHGDGKFLHGSTVAAQ